MRKSVFVVLAVLVFVGVGFGTVLLEKRAHYRELQLRTPGLTNSVAEVTLSESGEAGAKSVAQGLIEACKAKRMDKILECFKPIVRESIRTNIQVGAADEIQHRTIGKVTKQSDGSWSVLLMYRMRNGQEKVTDKLIVEGNEIVAWTGPN